jgi:hypothetical protein
VKTLWTQSPERGHKNAIVFVFNREVAYESAALPTELGWPVFVLNDLRAGPQGTWIQLDSN